MNQRNFSRISAALVFIIAVFTSTASAWAAVKVITVPANADNLTIPHLAYNGHKTTLKAIARGFSSTEEVSSALVTWDTNGDGSFADETPQSLAQCTGTYGGITCYDLSKVITIPTQDTSKLFNFTVRLSVSGQPDVFASYPVYVRADVPAQTNPSNNGTALPQNATDEQLEVMRAVALDDALWYQHLQIVGRLGTWAGIYGSLGDDGPFNLTLATPGAALLLFERTGHLPAYPPGTYNHTINPGSWYRPASSPLYFPTTNDVRWNNDPYAEDAMRLFNYLVMQLVPYQLGSYASYWADEADDGTTPVPGTNDGVALTFNTFRKTQFAEGSLPLAAIASSGLAGTVAQVGSTSSVQGRSIEFIVQQMVDYFAYAQIDSYGFSNFGGWQYEPQNTVAWNTEDFVRGIFLGFEEATKSMGQAGVYVNNRVRDRAMSFFKYNQANSKLAFAWGYGNCPQGNFAETGDALIALGYLGWSTYSTNDATVLTNDAAGVPITKGQARQIFNSYLNGAGSQWVSFQNDCQNWVSGFFFNDNGTNPTPYLRTDRMGNIRAIFGYAHALANLPNASEFSLINGHDWKREFSTYLIRNQFSYSSPYFNGYWSDAHWPIGSALYSPDIYGPVLSTAYAGLMLTPNQLLSHPVAVGSASPLEVTEGCSGAGNGNVTFGHDGSFHLDPARQISEFQWLFDDPASCFDCIDWSVIPKNSYSDDRKAWRGTEPDVLPMYTYQKAGVYKAALRVIDNNTPAQTNEYQILITVRQSPNQAPVAIAGGPYTIDSGSGVTLNGSVSDLNAACGDTISYAWELNNNGLFNDAVGATPSLSAAQLQALGLGIGTHTITLRVTDSYGATGTATATLTISDNQPFAVVSADIINAGCSQPVNFDASGSYHGRPDRSIVNYEWDFDFNGVFSPDASGMQVSHAYSSFGVHSTAVRVTDNNVPAKTAVTAIVTNVNQGNLAPVVNPGGPYTTSSGNGVTLNGSASFDPNVSCGDSIVSYQWNIGNGTYTLTGATPSLTAAQVDTLGTGTHSVQLTVMDTFGATGVVTTALSINNSKPVAVFSANPNPSACGQTVQFNGGGSTGQGISYAWTFGDGTSATGSIVNHAYSAFGTYTATLTITDNNVPAQTATATVLVNVSQGNLAPVANVGGLYSADLGQGVVLNGNGSSDSNTSCGDSIVSYQWNIGNGTYTLTGATPSLTAAQVNALGAGTHSVQLIVMDEFGSTGTASTTLSIYDNKPIASFTTNPNPVACGQSVMFDASGSSHGSPQHSIVSYSWNFGDGTTDSGVNVTHTYAAFGSYAATLTITDDNVPPKTASTSLIITVSQGNNAPVANAGGPYAIILGNGVTLNGTASSDPNVSCGDSIVGYEWDLNNDGLFNDAFGATPSLTAAQLAALGVDAGTYTIQLKVTDTFGLPGTASTTLSISSNPVAENQSVVSDEDTPASITLKAFDPKGGSLTYILIKEPLHGTLSGTAPGLIYTPNANYSGPDSFTFKVSDGALESNIAVVGITVTPVNDPPVADAGINITILSQDQFAKVVHGSASDLDNSALKYRWIEGSSVLADWSPVGTLGEAPLALSTVSKLSIGIHYLILEVDDGSAIVGDEMILTLDNSAPNAVASGSGTYQYGSPVSLGGEVSDFDGELLTYEWVEGSTVLLTGNVATTSGGTPVSLPVHSIANLSIGTHTLALRAQDAVHIAESQITVEVIDQTAPTLSPKADKNILWPPDHRMETITLVANAKDNSGGTITLSAVVTSNEPQDGLGDGDSYPDWIQPAIDQAQGLIRLQLRAERSSKGEGRIYTVTITATDPSGNSSSADVTVLVPHDVKKK